MTSLSGIAALRKARVVVIAAGLAVLGSASPTPAQPVGSCPPPKKLAAGACVTACPGGYEDQGSVCAFRNQSR